MSKIIIASHHKLAKGLKDTLEYILPNSIEIIPITAYVDDRSIGDLVSGVFDKIDEGEQVIAFTDIMGGSVNQEFAKRIGRENYYLITGVNLPLLLNITLLLQNGEVDEEDIRNAIEESKNQMIFVNDAMVSSNLDDEDE